MWADMSYQASAEAIKPLNVLSCAGVCSFLFQGYKSHLTQCLVELAVVSKINFFGGGC